MAVFVTRAEAGLVPPKSHSHQVDPVGVAIHHVGGGSYAKTDHADCLTLWRQIQSWHLSNTNEGYQDIAYNLGACHHGSLFEGRSQQGHAKVRPGSNGTTSANTRYVSICALWGVADGAPSAAIIQVLGEGVAWLRANAGAGDKVVGHRDLVQTTCPGTLYPVLGQVATVADGGTVTPPDPKPDPTPDPKPKPKPKPEPKLPPDWMGEWPYPRDHYFGPPPASGYRDSSRVHNGKSDPVAYQHVQNVRRTLRWRGWNLVAASGYYNGPPPPASPCEYGFSEEICKFQRAVMKTSGDGYLGPKTWDAIRKLAVT